MSRLIDADLLMKTVFNDVVLVDGEVKGVGLILAETVDKAHTIDAVPAVRCRECKHAYINSFSAASGVALCRLLTKRAEGIQIVMQQDDFCSYGERKEGAD